MAQPEKLKQGLTIVNELLKRGKIKPEMANEFRVRLNKQFDPDWNDPGGFLDTKVLDNLPMAGGIGGGIVGGAAGAAETGLSAGLGAWAVPALVTGGATLGGMAGESLRATGKHLIGSDNAPDTLQNLKNMLGSGIEQGTYAAGGELGGQLLGRGLQAVSKYTPLIKAKVRGAVESVPGIGGWFEGSRTFKSKAAKDAYDLLQAQRKAAFIAKEQARKIAYNATKEGVQSNIKAIPKRGRVDAAAGLQETVSQAEKTMVSQLDDVVAPIINKYGDKVITAEPVRQNILKILGKNNMIDDVTGSIVPNAMDDVLLPAERTAQKYVVKLSEQFSKNPTVRNLDIMRKKLQRAANFGGASRTPEQKMYGELSRTIKETLLDGLGEIAPKAKTALASARATFSKTKSVMDELTKITKQYPEQIAARSGSQMPGTFIKDAIKKVPQTKQPIADVVANDIIRSSNTPKAFTKALDKYGRDTLAELFDAKTYKAIMEYEKQLAQASKPFVPSRFVPQKMPPEPLGKFWSGVKNTAEKGGKINPAYVRILFQNMTNALSGGKKEPENVKQ